MSVGARYSCIAICGLALFLSVASRPVFAQRLCENSDSAVATISPCTGPPGTAIALNLRRALASPPKTLVFKRVLANGVPAQVIVPVGVPTPAELCTGGSGRWEVWLVDAADVSQGVVGAFWPDCRGMAANASGGAGVTNGGAAGDQRLCENSDSAVAKISPCVGPAGTKINISLRRNLASAPAALLFKRVLTNGVLAQVSAPIASLAALSPAQLCATGGNGKWEVWLLDAAGASQGVIGAFWPDCGGSDPCLVGKWRSDSVTNGSPATPKSGGSGIQLAVNTNGLATIIYTGMQPIKQVNPAGQLIDTAVYSGTGTAFITGKNGLITVGTVQSSAITSKITDARTGKTRDGRLGGLGEIFYGGGKIAGFSLNYTCGGGNLVIKQVLGTANVMEIVTFKRQ